MHSFLKSWRLPASFTKEHWVVSSGRVPGAPGEAGAQASTVSADVPSAYESLINDRLATELPNRGGQAAAVAGIIDLTDARPVDHVAPLVEVKKEPLRIAMIGQRGIPATFGGVEHHVEELGAALAARGHSVTVFCRNNYVDRRLAEYRGMRLRHLPTVGTKHLDAIVHSALSTAVACGESYDIIHYHAVGPGIPAALPRFLSKSKVVLTVHGLDGERAKWGVGARTILKSGEWLSAHVPDATIVVSESIADHYLSHYGRATSRIANGVNVPLSTPSTEALGEFGLNAGKYVLFVGRIVPEKAPDLLIRAFGRVETDMSLVIVGDSSYTNEFVDSVRLLGSKDSRVVFTGYLFGDRLSQLYSNAAAFVLPSSLEGLPLTLLEAGSHGTPLIASDIAPHLEVIGDEGPGHRLFPSGNERALTSTIQRALANQAVEKASAALFREHILETYRWDKATTATESVYFRCLSQKNQEEAIVSAVRYRETGISHDGTETGQLVHVPDTVS